MQNDKITKQRRVAGSFDQKFSGRLLTRDEVASLYGLSKRWLEVAPSKNQGPPIVRISPRMVRYRASDIEAWIETCVDQQNGSDRP